MQTIFLFFSFEISRLFKKQMLIFIINIVFAFAFIDVKMETLKIHEFHPWCYFVTLSCVLREYGSHACDQP